jgi:hypothetical protein
MKNPRLRSLAALLVLGLLAGCDDLVVGTGGTQVTGLTIEDASGTTLVTVAGTQVTGSLQVAAGAERTLVVTLRGPAGPLSPTLGETVRVTVTNPGVASWADAGGGTGTLRGGSTGQTTLRVDLLRSAAAVYTSPSIAVTVS